MMNIDHLLELDRLAKADGRKFDRKRDLYEVIAHEGGDHFIGIVGPRGSGKTIILRQLAAANERSFYVSLDALEGNLFELAKTLQETMQVNLFLLDEVHAYSHFEADLKKLYDALHVRVIFTSSTALGMYDSAYDLSRRVLLKTLYPFSLREYAKFKYGQEFERVTFEDLVERRIPSDILRSGEHFTVYLQGGLMPFALSEPQPLKLLENILGTVIHKDIPRIAKLFTEELEAIERVVRFIGRSAVDGINYSSVAQNVHITKYKAQQYITLLERAFVLQRVFPRGTNVLKEPKVLMAVPYRLLYKSFDEAIGGLREDFFIEACRSLGKEIYYLKSTRGQKTPDYFMRDREDMVFEIGGKGKGRSQFKGISIQRKIVFADGYDIADARRPLFLAGMLTG